MTASNTDCERNDRPSTPAEEDCCGNGCDPCIFDIHKKLLNDWENKKLNKLKVSTDKNLLSLIKYSKFVIRDIINASEDCILMTLHCTPDNKDASLYLNPGQHIILNLKFTSKPYTPVLWTQKSLTLLIKLYPTGKASCRIRQLEKGDELLIRGPYGDFKYQQNSFKNVIMLSIGSGIAAIYPIAISIVANELEDTKVNMISGFHSTSHVPLKDELRRLSDYWNFECTLCIPQKSVENITGIKIVNSHINEDLINEILSSYSPESTLILICGNTKFNKTLERIITEKEFSQYHVFQ